jgi:ubiquinone/menaquinone biosynthesis C-methylase UbiE
MDCEEKMREYYNSGIELTRLAKEIGPLELERTRELIARYLPPSPAAIYDIGGAHGPYAFWLAGMGYQAHLLDAISLHIEQARKTAEDPAAPRLAGMHVGDARCLPFANDSAEAVILHGPLYHLVEKADRLTAVREAWRVLKPGGLLLAFAISSYASTIVGIRYGHVWDTNYLAICESEVKTGRHERPAGWRSGFITTFFHHPSVLITELQEGGFACERVLGIHGPAWNVPDFTASWNNPAHRDVILHIARLTEQEPVLSPHMMAVGRKWVYAKFTEPLCRRFAIFQEL